jgi:hypothetical protein
MHGATIKIIRPMPLENISLFLLRTIQITKTSYVLRNNNFFNVKLDGTPSE